MSSLTELLATIQKRGDTYVVTPTEDWTQGRTIYGGLSLALAAHVARLAFPDLPPLRSAQAAYTGAAAGELRITPTRLAAGKSSSFIAVDIHSESGQALRATLCFGVSRNSSVQLKKLPMPAVRAPSDCPEFFGNGVTPGFSGQFDSHLAGNHGLVSGANCADLLAWFRHRDQQLADTETGLLALADAAPPSAMLMFDEPAPISTMTWAVDILTDTFSNRDWYLIQSMGESIADGYCSQAMTVWGKHGQAVAVARQTVAIYR